MSPLPGRGLDLGCESSSAPFRRGCCERRRWFAGRGAGGRPLAVLGSSEAEPLATGMNASRPMRRVLITPKTTSWEDFLIQFLRRRERALDAGPQDLAADVRRLALDESSPRTIAREFSGSDSSAIDRISSRLAGMQVSRNTDVTIATVARARVYACTLSPFSFRSRHERARIDTVTRLSFYGVLLVAAASLSVLK